MKVWTLSPAKCMFCGLYACYEELTVCHRCIHRIQDLLNEKCKKCGKTASGCECADNQKVRFLFFFESITSKNIVYMIKHNADDRVVDLFAELMINGCGINPKTYDCVTYVPRSRKNVWHYGYDQSKELAKSVSKLFGIPLAVSLKRIGGKEQKLLSYSQRFKNIKNMYVLKEPPEEKYNRVLLIDDVSTTGATIDACTSLLKSGFAKTVVPIVLAKTTLSKK